MNRRIPIMRLGFAVMSMTLLPGCFGRLLSEGAGAFTGASGKAVDISPIASGKPLGEFGSVEFSALSTNLPSVPESVLSGIRSHTLHMLTEDKLFVGGGRALKISGSV